MLPESGFNVAKALVRTEGTCMIVLEAKLRLIKVRSTGRSCVSAIAIRFPAADHVPEILPLKPVQAPKVFEEASSMGLKEKKLPTWN